MLLEVFLAGIALLLLAVLWDRKPSGMPPGPTEIPFIGQHPALTSMTAKALRDQYGNLVTTRVGNLRMVYVFDYSDVKDLFARQEFSHRPDFFKKFNLDHSDNVGVVFNNGPLWSHGRRFILRQLRALGTGTSRLEEALLMEARAMVQHIAAYQGQPVTDLLCFEIAALNVIWLFTTGRRYSLDAEEIHSLYAKVQDVKDMSKFLVLGELFPVLSWLPTFLQNKIFGEKRLRNYLDSMKNLAERSVTERQDTVDYGAPRDFINDYLKEMEEQDDQGDSNQGLRIEGLHQIMFDLFNAGSETVADMLRWVTYYMAKYPDIAARCQKEIDAVLPSGELVTLEHKQRLPFVEAFTTEVLRHSSLILFLPQRIAEKDASVGGYTLPKGTAITTCTHLIHRDPRHWTDPDKFSPDRFLDESGNHKPRRDGFLAFGTGRRQCVGEALARAELFLFSAALLQNFHVRPPDGAKLQEEPYEPPPMRLPHGQPFVFTLRHPLDHDNIIS